MKMVLGLGNPGKRYERTRHNVGFRVVDELAERDGALFRRSWRVKAHCCNVRIEGENVLLVKPQTFMNLSGRAVAPLMRKKGIKPVDVIVVMDDVDLPVGQLRIRGSGGAGGHKGLRSVIETVGTDAIARVRIGVGRGQGEGELVGHVLSAFGAKEEKAIDEAVGQAVEAVGVMIEHGVDKAMNDFNG